MGTPYAMAIGGSAALSDDEVIARVKAGEIALYEIVMRRYNQRLYRVVRGIISDEAEAEDVMQESYVRAFTHLDQFEGRAKFGTWLIRIAIHEALERLRRRSRMEEMDAEPLLKDRGDERFASRSRNPEQAASNEELRALLEKAVERLPEGYRSVFVLRAIEEMNTKETAECLGITTKAVKIRLHRARKLLKAQLYALTGARAPSAYPLHLAVCDRVVNAVFQRVASGCAESD